VELGQPYTFTSIPTKISSRTTIPTPTEMPAAEPVRHFERRSWTLVDSMGRKRCRFELAPVSPGLLHPSDDFRLVLEKVGYPGPICVAFLYISLVVASVLLGSPLKPERPPIKGVSLTEAGKRAYLALLVLCKALWHPPRRLTDRFHADFPNILVFIGGLGTRCPVELR
jgi:hypothetical protein